jgi:hypothetical protein
MEGTIIIQLQWKILISSSNDSLLNKTSFLQFLNGYDYNKGFKLRVSSIKNLHHISELREVILFWEFNKLN